jgi:hypothetical protein
MATTATLMTSPNNEFIAWLRTIKPWDIVKYATAVAVVVFWVLAVITTILYMVGYY